MSFFEKSKISWSHSQWDSFQQNHASVSPCLRGESFCPSCQTALLVFSIVTMFICTKSWAQATPELTFHAAPKPLPAGAAVSDWPCFLGPTHNGFSTETKLLQKFPANGLAA